MKPPELYQQFSDNEPLIYFTIKLFYPDLLYNEDIRQVGAIGLWKACNNYNPDKGTFSTYAVDVIHRQIQRYYFLNYRRITAKDCTFISLDDKTHSKDEETDIANIIPDREATHKLEEIEIKIDFKIFRKQLSIKEQEVVNMLEQGYNPYRISLKIGVSPQAICSRLDKIRKKAVKAGLRV